ncbi:hypothetical protein V6N12_042039 [Hibiscus sabdariffa]|uniref:Uncharacterized protein n=1 Tax=Hibiscus sabdariffa TaxID=183260 RepID=A0ABR2EDL5_9ROSI
MNALQLMRMVCGKFYLLRCCVCYGNLLVLDPNNTGRDSILLASRHIVNEHRMAMDSQLMGSHIVMTNTQVTVRWRPAKVRWLPAEGTFSTSATGPTPSSLSSITDGGKRKGSETKREWQGLLGENSQSLGPYAFSKQEIAALHSPYTDGLSGNRTFRLENLHCQ